MAANVADLDNSQDEFDDLDESSEEDDLELYSSDSGDNNLSDSDSDGDDIAVGGPWDRPWVRVVDPNADTAPVHDFGFDYAGQTGPQNVLPQDVTPVDYFLMLLDGILELFVDETNAYGDATVNRNRPLRRRSRLNDWAHVDIDEMKAFLGLIVNMGLIKKTRINEYWDVRHMSQSTPYFGDVMPRDRFLLLLRMFNFPARPQVDNRNETVALARVNNLVDHLVMNFERYYRPEQMLSVDESLIGYSGRWTGIQYMPAKHHHRFGVKLWALCESSTGYTCRFSIYSGRGDEARPFHVVMRLMDPYLDHGYSLFTDNFYTSPDLAVELYRRNTLLTGTTRKNRQHLPQCVKENLDKGNVVAARKGPLLAVAWMDKKHVIVCSTAYCSRMMQVESARHRQQNMPEAVRFYRLHMGGVDLGDMRLYHFLDERKTIKWTKKVLFSLLGRALLNAFIIYDKNYHGDKKLCRLEFQISVVEGLVNGRRAKRPQRGRPPIPAVENRLVIFDGHVKRKLPVGSKKDCKNCSDRHGPRAGSEHVGNVNGVAQLYALRGAMTVGSDGILEPTLNPGVEVMLTKHSKSHVTKSDALAFLVSVLFF